MKVIDVHNHLYPKEWIAYLEARGGSPTVVRTGPTNMVFYYEGARLATVNRAGHYDPEPSLKDLDEYGIDVQLISLTTPSVELVPAAEGVVWAKKVNDYFASVCQKYRGRFHALATLPYQDVKESVKELERAKKELGAKGITLFSNIQGKPIYAKEFNPIYEAAEAYDLPIFIHPAGKTSCFSRSARSFAKASGTRPGMLFRPACARSSITATARNIGFLSYSYPSLPFGQDPKWTRWAGYKAGGYSGADTGLRSFQDWWIGKLVDFAKATGAAGFSFDHWWIKYDNASSKYAQWYGCPRVLETLRRRVPDIVIDGRQQYMNFGPWTWLAGSYPHPTLDEQPESFTAFPDLHTDRVSAHRQRFAAWIYRMPQLYKK